MTIAERAEAEARRWLGTPYRHQASVRGAGCDCLGLLRGVWRGLYGGEPQKVPPYAADMRRDAEPGLLLRAAETHLVRVTRPILSGDVLLFRIGRNLPPRHCAIATAGRGLIHAQERLGVIEAPFSLAWQRRLAGVFAFPDS
ncbi:MAG: C40 family peptidase [Alphaproteobacteria bacterium]|nr:C40 family peptidase [Alphaproteobacteria bacterium]